MGDVSSGRRWGATLGKLASLGLLALAGLILLGPTSASAAAASIDLPAGTSPTGADALQVSSYQDDFEVSKQTAEESLQAQEDGAGIVEQLEDTQGKNYAGVWFDNESGEFVVPVLAGVDSTSVTNLLEGDGLESDFRIRHVQSSWGELEAAHERLDKALLPLIEESLVQTSIDPRVNAVVISEAEGTSAAERAQIQARAAAESVDVEVRQGGGETFDVSTAACRTVTPRSCGRPLRGGVAITPTCTNCSYAYGECTAGFKGIGDITGDRYILTAGHCAAKFSQWGSADASSIESMHPIGSVQQYSFPGGDWAKIKATGSSYWDWNPWPSEVAHYWEDQERPITNEGSSYLGEYVCHSGNKTGTSCGNVSALDYTVTVDSTGAVIYHETRFGDVCSIGGDSGGPVFTGTIALGLYSASSGESSNGACDATSYYVEITQATDAMGVHVAPRIPPPPPPPPPTWHSGDPLGGNIVSDPEISTWGSGRLDVFGRGADNTLQHRWHESPGAGWSGWENLGGALASGVGSVSWAPGRVDVVGRSSTNHLLRWWYDGLWHSEDLLGDIRSDPDVSSWGPGRLDVFAKGPDNSLYHKWLEAGKWSGWESLGGVLNSGPAAVSWGPGRIDVVARATDNSIAHWWYDGAWHIDYLGGVLSDDPDISSWGPGRLDVFSRCSGAFAANLCHKWYVPSVWSGWESLGGEFASGVGAAAWGFNRIDVVGRVGSGVTHWWYGP
jgi:Repeat of unknown function (DUF346)